MQLKVTMPYLKDQDQYAESLLEVCDQHDRHQKSKATMKSYMFMLLSAALLTLAVHLLILMQWYPKEASRPQPTLGLQSSPSIVYCNVSTFPSASVYLLTIQHHSGTSSNIKSTLYLPTLGTTVSISDLPRMIVMSRGLTC